MEQIQKDDFGFEPIEADFGFEPITKEVIDEKLDKNIQTVIQKPTSADTVLGAVQGPLGLPFGTKQQADMFASAGLGAAQGLANIPIGVANLINKAGIGYPTKPFTFAEKAPSKTAAKIGEFVAPMAIPFFGEETAAAKLTSALAKAGKEAGPIARTVGTGAARGAYGGVAGSIFGSENPDEEAKNSAVYGALLNSIGRAPFEIIPFAARHGVKYFRNLADNGVTTSPEDAKVILKSFDNDVISFGDLVKSPKLRSFYHGFLRWMPFSGVSAKQKAAIEGLEKEAASIKSDLQGDTSDADPILQRRKIQQDIANLPSIKDINNLETESEGVFSALFEDSSREDEIAQRQSIQQDIAELPGIKDIKNLESEAEGAVYDLFEDSSKTNEASQRQSIQQDISNIEKKNREELGAKYNAFDEKATKAGAKFIPENSAKIATKMLEDYNKGLESRTSPKPDSKFLDNIKYLLGGNKLDKIEKTRESIKARINELNKEKELILPKLSTKTGVNIAKSLPKKEIDKIIRESPEYSKIESDQKFLDEELKKLPSKEEMLYEPTEMDFNIIRENLGKWRELENNAYKNGEGIKGHKYGIIIDAIKQDMQSSLEKQGFRKLAEENSILNKEYKEKVVPLSSSENQDMKDIAFNNVNLNTNRLENILTDTRNSDAIKLFPQSLKNKIAARILDNDISKGEGLIAPKVSKAYTNNIGKLDNLLGNVSKSKLIGIVNKNKNASSISQDIKDIALNNVDLNTNRLENILTDTRNEGTIKLFPQSLKNKIAARILDNDISKGEGLIAPRLYKSYVNNIGNLGRLLDEGTKRKFSDIINKNKSISTINQDMKDIAFGNVNLSNKSMENTLADTRNADIIKMLPNRTKNILASRLLDNEKPDNGDWATPRLLNAHSALKKDTNIDELMPEEIKLRLNTLAKRYDILEPAFKFQKKATWDNYFNWKRHAYHLGVPFFAYISHMISPAALLLGASKGASKLLESESLKRAYTENIMPFEEGGIGKSLAKYFISSQSNVGNNK